MDDWYEQNIEEGVRDIVRHLRNNGFNTECSCEHEMFVQIGHSLDGELMRLHSLLFSYFARRDEKVSYEIRLRHTVMDKCPFTSVDVLLTGREKHIDHLRRMAKYHEDRAEQMRKDITQLSAKQKRCYGEEGRTPVRVRGLKQHEVSSGRRT